MSKNGGIIFLVLFGLSWMTFMVGWSQGWRAHDDSCPPHITAVLEQQLE